MQRRRENSICSKKRNSVGNMNNRAFEQEKLTEEVENYPDGIAVNWSDLARRHNIITISYHNIIYQHQGRISKKWRADSTGMAKVRRSEHWRFKRKNDGNDMRIRRKKLRGQGGEITVATPQSIDQVKGEMRKKISSGEYTVGQQIAPRKYQKMTLNENGEVVKTKFVVEGRKQPLVEIREQTFMRQRTDDEYEKIMSESLKRCLKAINEYHEGESVQSMRYKLKHIERTRHLKV